MVWAQLIFIYADVQVFITINGLSVSATYKNGKLIRAETRGDGRVGEELRPQFRVVLPELSQFSDTLKGTAPTGNPMVNLIQAPKIKAVIIADLRGLRFCDTPFHQRILLTFTAAGLICGNTLIHTYG